MTNAQTLDQQQKLAAEMNRMLWESLKFQSEQQKLAAEQQKLVAERIKLSNEAMKFEREHKWYPLVVVAGSLAAGAALMGAGVTVAKIFMAG